MSSEQVSSGHDHPSEHPHEGMVPPGGTFPGALPPRGSPEELDNPARPWHASPVSGGPSDLSKAGHCSPIPKGKIVDGVPVCREYQTGTVEEAVRMGEELRKQGWALPDDLQTKEICMKGGEKISIAPWEAESRWSLSVTVETLRQLLAPVLPASVQTMVDVEWDGKNGRVKFFFENGPRISLPRKGSGTGDLPLEIRDSGTAPNTNVIPGMPETQAHNPSSRGTARDTDIGPDGKSSWDPSCPCCEARNRPQDMGS